MRLETKELVLLGAIRGLPARDDGAEGEWSLVCVEKNRWDGDMWGRREREKGDGETRERYEADKRETKMCREQESLQETNRAERKPDKQRKEKEIHPGKESEQNWPGNVGPGLGPLSSPRGTPLAQCQVSGAESE